MKVAPARIYSELRDSVKQLTNDIGQNNLEFTTLFFIYGYFRQKNDQAAHIETSFGPFSQFLNQEIQCLGVNSDQIKEHLNPISRIVLDSSEDVDLLSKNDFHLLNDLSASDYLSHCIIQMANTISKDTGDLITPTATLSLIHALSGPQLSGKFLDLNARTGEWAENILRSDESLEINVTNFCFDSHHQILSLMRLRLKENRHHESQLFNKFNLSEVNENAYDLVFSNPPFGKPPRADHREYRGTQEAFFLDHALIASKPDGKVIFIVPEGFLFRNNQRRNEDFYLRKQLTDDKAIKTIIRLPDSTFFPFAKIRTAILVIDKGIPNEEVSFIDIDKNPGELTLDEISKIALLTGASPPLTGVSFKQVESQQIIENQYDWQVQRYLSAPFEHDFRNIKAIKQTLESKEAELMQTQQEIKAMIKLMEINE